MRKARTRCRGTANTTDPTVPTWNGARSAVSEKSEFHWKSMVRYKLMLQPNNMFTSHHKERMSMQDIYFTLSQVRPGEESPVAKLPTRSKKHGIDLPTCKSLADPLVGF